MVFWERRLKKLSGGMGGVTNGKPKEKMVKSKDRGQKVAMEINTAGISKMLAVPFFQAASQSLQGMWLL